MPSGNTPFIPDCGYCTACYATEEDFYDFEMTTVTRVNATHVQLLCDVTSNVPQFFINWSISDPEAANGRMRLDDGDVIDDRPVSVINERQGSDGYMSTLIAPEAVLDRDIQCIANSDFGPQPSGSGSFQLIEGIAIITNAFCCMHSGKPIKFIRHVYSYIKSLRNLLSSDATDDFPSWAIIIVAIVCLLTLTCLIVAAALIAGLACSCSRTRRRKFEPTGIHRLVN
jgi:hypothetical protein